MTENRIQKQVRKFYDEVGWQKVEDDRYQNAQFEDLRPVSREYIHRCHLRVNRYLKPIGKLLLDAGSGPVQYPEYLTYSAGYQYRVCLDVSLTALLEAHKRLKEQGLCVLGDVTHLPFPRDLFDGTVSLHTLHHLTVDDQVKAYSEVYRTISPGASGVVVNGWKKSPLMQKMDRIITLMERFTKREKKLTQLEQTNEKELIISDEGKPERTFVDEINAPFLNQKLGGKIPIEIFVWRSVNVRFLRALIHFKLGGRFWLRLVYWLEERFPHYLGKNGAYPLVVINKKETIN